MFDNDREFDFEETEDCPSGDSFTGVFVTGQSDSSTLLVQVYEQGNLEDTAFVDAQTESVEEAINDAVNQIISDSDEDEEFQETPDVLIDSKISETFEKNLAKFPYESEDYDTNDDIPLISPQERAEIEAELEDEAEDAYTRFLDKLD